MQLAEGVRVAKGRRQTKKSDGGTVKNYYGNSKTVIITKDQDQTRYKTPQVWGVADLVVKI